MRVPILVPLGPYKVPIRYVRRCHDDEFGHYDQDERLIRISKRRCVLPDIVWATVWHELAHAAIAIAGGGNLITLAREEAIVGAIEFALAPLMLMRPDAAGVRWRDVAFPFETE